MNPNELVEVFEKYGFISGRALNREDALDLMDEELEASINALELLSELAEDRLIWFSLGDCVDEDVVEEFLANFEKIKEISDGKVAPVNLKVTPEVGTAVDEEQGILITFDWNGKTYEFSFSKIEPDEFVSGFSKWAFDAFDEEFLFVNEDHPFGYHLPKKLIDELDAIGLHNAIVQG